jgi:type IV secretory pathway TrbL component
MKDILFKILDMNAGNVLAGLCIIISGVLAGLGSIMWSWFLAVGVLIYVISN